MMAQYDAIKNQNPDCLLFFRLGDFYELFGEDAREASRLLGITLTARSSGEGRSVKVPMAGVPYHAAPGYLRKLIKAGKKVAICEQVGDPSQGKGMMRRELVRIVTPGTVLDEGVLEGKANNFLVAALAGKKGCSLAAADNSTGLFLATELGAGLSGVESELERLRPAECLLPESEGKGELAALLSQRRIHVTLLEDHLFTPAEGARVLKGHFGVSTLESFGLKEGAGTCGAAGALLAYLKKTQLSPLTHFTGLQTYASSSFMGLDASTLRHLELTANQEDGSQSGTLAEVLDRTRTAAGSRLLKRWLTAPLTALEPIRQRHEAVGELKDAAQLRAALKKELESTSDIERILGRVGCLSAHPRDLAGLRDTLACLPALGGLLAACQGALLKTFADGGEFSSLFSALTAALVPDPPLSWKEGGLIAPGYSAELDRLVADSHGGKETMLAIQLRERERSGIATLKVQFNSVFGYFMEVSRAQLDKVPADFERKQTLVNAERFTTPELKQLEERVLHAEERRCRLEEGLFTELRSRVSVQSAGLMALAGRLGALDVLLSFADAAEEGGYARPRMDDSEVLEIEEGRHPVVEFLQRREGGPAFVPNDTRLDTETQQMLLITGPNMAGKSTYMRQVALIVLMAQAGSFVPARAARVGLVDRVFTRVGASDRLSKGMSTFLVEMTETAYILRHATRRSLVVLDEIGRGTSTFDGVSIAWAVAEHLHEAPQLGCRTLFATHYFELAELAASFSRIKNYCVAVREWNGKILFLHQILPGSSEHSHGVAVARLAGVPDTVLKRAREVLGRLESLRHFKPRQPADLSQADLFPPEQDPRLAGLADALKDLDLDGMTPREALGFLSSWKEKLKFEG